MIKLYCGDCLESFKQIKSNSVNLVLADPPYNISQSNNLTTMNGKRQGLDFGEWDYNFDLFHWMDELPRILSKNGSAIIFGSWWNIGNMAKYCERIGFKIKDCFRWIKTNPMPRNRDRRYVVDYEFAFWVVRTGAKWVFNRLSETYERPEFKCSVVGAKGRIHPTEKPVELLKHLIKIHSNEGDIILDPFMGSGSTGIAAYKTNRQFIGIELDQEYYNKASERIKKEIKEVENGKQIS